MSCHETIHRDGYGVLLCLCMGSCGSSKKSEEELKAELKEEIMQELEQEAKQAEPAREEPMAAEETPEPKAKITLAEDEIRPELKEFLDSYEAFVDEYVEFMQSYVFRPKKGELMPQQTWISFYLSQYRVHAFQDAIRAIGSPKYIRFLINEYSCFHRGLFLIVIQKYKKV